jgi:hypothetical protein
MHLWTSGKTSFAIYLFDAPYKNDQSMTNKLVSRETSPLFEFCFEHTISLTKMEKMHLCSNYMHYSGYAEGIKSCTVPMKFANSPRLNSCGSWKCFICSCRLECYFIVCHHNSITFMFSGSVYLYGIVHCLACIEDAFLLVDKLSTCAG